MYGFTASCDRMFHRSAPSTVVPMSVPFARPLNVFTSTAVPVYATSTPIGMCVPNVARAPHAPLTLDDTTSRMLASVNPLTPPPIAMPTPNPVTSFGHCTSPTISWGSYVGVYAAGGGAGGSAVVVVVVVVVVAGGGA